MLIHGTLVLIGYAVSKGSDEPQAGGYSDIFLHT